MRPSPSLVAGLALALAFAFASPASAGSPLHPPVVLLDEEGAEVLETGKPVSPMVTCGECHDTDYIAEHSYHVAVGFDERFEPGSVAGVPPWNTSPGTFGRWDARRYRRLTVPGEAAFDLGVADWIRLFGDRHAGGGPAFLARDGGPLADRRAGEAIDPETHALDPETGEPVPWDWQASGAVEMNCFLCHLGRPDNAARIDEIRAGAFAWAATATLGKTGLVTRQGDGTWAYERSAFAEDGSVTRERLGIVDPRSRNCGQCHGLVHEGAEPVTLTYGLNQWETASKGQVFSAQLVRDSALNLANKEGLSLPWDVHAARLVVCTDCHTSLNNPVFFSEAERSRPSHLSYDARRPSIGDYLTKPSHNFTKGESAQGTTARRLDGTMRRCEDCHDALQVHEEWLPNPRRHLRTMLCETCHVPRVHAPARQQTDWTVLTTMRGPRIEYRGTDGPIGDPATLLPGFEPVILPRHQKNGRIRHGPHNLCTCWSWVGGEPERPVRTRELEAAWFVGDAYHPDVVAALDEDGDGRLAREELRLDTEAKAAAVKARLEAVGVKAPRIAGWIQPLSLHHGVAPGAFATRRCETCHARESRLTRPFELSSYVPAGATAKLVGDSNIRMPGRTFTSEGRLFYEPVPTASGRYVIGHDRAGWIDLVGAFLVIGTLLGVLAHALLRRHHTRRREGAQA